MSRDIRGNGIQEAVSSILIGSTKILREVVRLNDANVV
jgi:hypothetical protein